MDDFAIKVENLSKDFKLPREKSSTIKSTVVNFWRRDRGYEMQHALKDVSFEIKKGELFGIVGRNGSGKSTLLKLLAGIYSPTKGVVHVNGKLTPFIELGVGFNMELTGRENVYLNGALLGFNRKEMQAMYKDIVKFAELEKFMDQKLKNYSSGMQVRLAFSIAIRAQSDILVLDEVLAVGDEAFQRKCYDYFEKLKRGDQTVVLVTHDMSAIDRFCERGILIDGGKVIREDRADIIARSYSDMFIQPVRRSGVQGMSKANRFGDMRLRFTHTSLNISKPKEYGSPIEIIAQVECQEPVDEVPIAAYALKDSVGQKLFGDKVRSSKLKKMKKSNILQIEFSFPNILQKGRYFIDLSIFLPRENVYTDCWLDCLVFSTMTKGVDGYPVVVNGTFKEFEK